MLGLRQWRCDGCGRRLLRLFARPTARVETVDLPAIGELRKHSYKVVRLYCKRCAEARKEGK